MPIKPTKGFYSDVSPKRLSSEMYIARYKSPYLVKQNDTTEALYPNRKIAVGPQTFTNSKVKNPENYLA